MAAAQTRPSLLETKQNTFQNDCDMTATATMPRLRTFTNRRLAREWKTVEAMIHIYCRDTHKGQLCAECESLLSYSTYGSSAAVLVKKRLPAQNAQSIATNAIAATKSKQSCATPVRKCSGNIHG